MIISTGEKLDIRQNQRKTPLMLAASYGNFALVKCLCENGAELDLRDTQGWTALMYGADGGHGNVVRLLLEHGADPDLISVSGEVAADMAARKSNPLLQRIIHKFSEMKGVNAWDDSSLQKNSEIDNVLIGLNAEKYKETFMKHDIGLKEFLTMSEEEMKEIGVENIGTRRRLMEGQLAIHRRSWAKTSLPALSLVDLQSGLRLNCPEAANVVGNLSNHAAYMKASISYMRLQIRLHGPTFVRAGSDVVDPGQLLELLGSCTDHIQSLESECGLLIQELTLLNQGVDRPRLPPDSLDISRRRGAGGSTWRQHMWKCMLASVIIGAPLILKANLT
eukprot:TRINITY_DN33076_c0_g1_i1.p1 TRINITY_DN33076_c0_g1~~TRINITY_DN33076_c0_g1_i1.p1  ORF type:complete len:374 (+),score=58.62 TRINITY_DN33076_c0_g1_i1:121-1122(+)